MKSEIGFGIVERDENFCHVVLPSRREAEFLRDLYHPTCEVIDLEEVILD